MSPEDARAVLDLVAADLLATTGLVSEVTVHADPEWGPRLDGPGDVGSELYDALGVVSDARDGLVEQVWGAWPKCPRDGRVLDPRSRDGDLWWVCVTGHPVSRVGALGKARNVPGP